MPELFPRSRPKSRTRSNNRPDRSPAHRARTPDARPVRRVVRSSIFRACLSPSVDRSLRDDPSAGLPGNLCDEIEVRVVVESRQGLVPRQRRRSEDPVPFALAGDCRQKPLYLASSCDMYGRSLDSSAVRVRRSANPTPSRCGPRIPPRGRRYQPVPPNQLVRVVRARTARLVNRPGSGRSYRPDGSTPRVISNKDRHVGEHVHRVANDL